MKKHLFSLAISTGASILLTACAGGGGSTGATTPTNFSTLSAVVAGSTVRASGLSLQTAYTSTAPSYAVATLGAFSTPTTSTTVDGSYNSSGLLNKLVIATPVSTYTIDSAAGAVFGTLIGSGGVIGAAASADSSMFAAYPYSPTSLGWEYQTFGIWETGRGTGSGTAGAVSIGSVTAGASIPTTGTATFTGYSGGAYVNAIGVDYLTTSAVSLVTDFAARSIAFSTTGTTAALTSNLAAGSSANTHLNTSGTLTWASATNSFTGAITNASGASLTGNVTGRFYGPTATEAGGVFGLKAASGVEAYAGAFGAKR